MFENANDRFRKAKSLFLIVRKDSINKDKDVIDIRPCDKTYREVKKAWKDGKFVIFGPVCFTVDPGVTLNDVLMHAAVEGVQIDFIEHMTEDWKTFKLVDNVTHETLQHDKDVESKERSHE